jgi:RHS repeat-associated protein
MVVPKKQIRIIMNPSGLKHESYNSDIKAYGKNVIENKVMLKQIAPTDGSTVAANVNQYKFNGMEYQTELGLNWYDMDMRDYDPAICRWTGIDPVTHFDQSPYLAMNGNPVFYADPSGADGVGGETYSSVFGMQVSTPNSSDRIIGYSVGHTFGSLDENIGAAWGDGGILPYNSIDRFDRANLDSFFDNLDHPKTQSNIEVGTLSEGVFDTESGGIIFPSFTILWKNYPHDINGEHQHPSSNLAYHNQCAIRMSVCLIMSGISLKGYPKDDLDKDNGKWALTANRLKYFISQYNKNFKKISQTEFESKYWNQTGIIYIVPPPGGVGHIDLFNQGKTGSGYYLGSEIWFWPIK